MRTRVNIDVDDVIVNFRKYYKEVARDLLDPKYELPDTWELSSNLNAHQALLMDCVMSDEGFIDNLEPHEGAIEAVMKLSSISDVYFVTAYYKKSKTWTFDRELWLVKHFGEELGRKVVHTKHKHVTFGHVFIDDKAENVRAWIDSNRMLDPRVRGLLFTQPHNLNEVGLERLNDLRDAIPIVKTFASDGKRCTCINGCKSWTCDRL